jgi:tetratricopeptide (TPR) repeat protein
MAKQRPQPKSKRQSTGSSSKGGRSAPEAPVSGTGELPRQPVPAVQPLPPPSPSRRSTYFEAVAVYERGIEALQRHDYASAVQLLESVLTLYPEEKELHERVRLYLNICRRHVTPQEATPQTVEERLYASTLAINGGRYDEAIAHLRLVRDEDPDNDHALYMLAVAHAQRGEHAEAIAHLERAIALNPETRGLARQDPDLEPVRQDESFRAALEVAPQVRVDRKRPVRTKSGR